MPPPKDMFDFASMRKPPTEIDPPSLQRYPARDGEQLAYRLYESTARRILIFIHGSSYHGGGYHALASALLRHQARDSRGLDGHKLKQIGRSG